MKLVLLFIAAPLLAVEPGDIWQFEIESTQYMTHNNELLFMSGDQFDVVSIDRIEFVDEEALTIHYTDGETRRGVFWDVSIDYAVPDVLSDGRFPFLRLEYIRDDRQKVSYAIALSRDETGRVMDTVTIDRNGVPKGIGLVYRVSFSGWWPDLDENAFDFPADLR